MIKKTTPALLFLMQFLFLQNSFCQAQTNVTDSISRKFLRYCESVPREEIFVHTDKEEYIAGEDLWFNVYLIDRQSLKPSLNSKIAYFELLNSENRPVVQKRFRIDKGFSPGQIVIPDTLRSGTYKVRAYTNWMKNFLPLNCFIKDINIYNAFSPKALRSTVSNINTLKAVAETSEWPSNPGLMLKVNNFKPDTLEIFVNADQKYRSENNNLFNLFIQTHGVIDHVSSEKIAENVTHITIPKSSLTKGINQITIFDSKGQPVCERYIYTPKEKNEQIIILNPIDSINTRSKVSLDFKVEDKLSANQGATNFSVSVVPHTDTVGIIDMYDYMVFGTEFGQLASGVINGKKISELPPGEMDSLLLTVQSDWINWKTILSGEPPQLRYQVEKDDHYISGTLITSDQQLAHPGEFLIMSTPGKVPLFQFARTDYKANFSFNVPIDEGIKDLIIQPDDTTRNNKILIESSFSDKYLQPDLSVDSIGRPLPPYISRWSANYQVQKIFGSSSVGDIVNSMVQPQKPKRFYGKPDVEILMKNYIKLPVMEEVFFELVPHVTLKKNKSDYEISVVDPFGNSIFDDPPSLMIDGVIIKNPSIIATLDPELVEKMDVIREKYFVGDYSFYGIVNVITKAGDFSYVSLPNYAIRLKYRVIDPVVTFASPDYSSAEMKASRTPDFRNTLYWNSSVKPDKDGKFRIEFWTSDIKSDYEINIQGITSGGESLSFRKIIKVK
jgi:hypothetical protein